MKPFDEGARRRVASIVRRLDVPDEGERLAALSALARTLQSSGLSMNDFADLIEKEVRRGSRSQSSDATGDQAPDWRHDVMVSIKLQLYRTDWEKSFLDGMMKWGRDPTPKQATLIREIFNRGG